MASIIGMNCFQNSKSIPLNSQSLNNAIFQEAISQDFTNLLQSITNPGKWDVPILIKDDLTPQVLGKMRQRVVGIGNMVGNGVSINLKSEIENFIKEYGDSNAKTFIQKVIKNTVWG